MPSPGPQLSIRQLERQKQHRFEISDSESPRKPLKARDNPEPAVMNTHITSRFDWDSMEVHVHVEVLGKPMIIFLMSRTRSHGQAVLHPSDFDLVILINTYDAEAKRGLVFGHDLHKFVYLDDETPFSIHNKGPIMLCSSDSSKPSPGTEMSSTCRCSLAIPQAHKRRLPQFKLDFSLLQ